MENWVDENADFRLDGMAVDAYYYYCYYYVDCCSVLMMADVHDGEIGIVAVILSADHGASRKLNCCYDEVWDDEGNLLNGMRSCGPLNDDDSVVDFVVAVVIFGRVNKPPRVFH